MAGNAGASEPVLTTPLKAQHKAHGARFIDFAGFEMPLQFEGILAEHEAVRDHAGVFDVSHMSNLDVGLDDAAALANALGADITRLDEGRAKYTVCLRPDGTILDDLIVFRLPDRFHVVPNAGMDRAVIEALGLAGVRTLANVSRETCILAVQGPEAKALTAEALGDDHVVGRFRARPIDDGAAYAGFVTGTGYTGEDGVELFLPPDAARDALQRLVKAGASPCGLGARDTLRLEKGYCLAGNEFDPPVSPVEAKLLWTVDLSEKDTDGGDPRAFVGADAVRARKERGPHAVLVGLTVTDKGIPRRDCDVHVPEGTDDGTPIGRVSSGTMSPSLGRGIALAYLAPAHAEPGTAVEVDVRGRRLAAEVAEVPFL